jgi:hypothetical protein
MEGMNESYMYSHSSFFIATTWQNKDFQISHTLKLAWVLIVRDSSAVRRHYIFLLEPWDVRELYIRKTADLPSNSGSAHFHVSWLLDFIFYQKPLCKSLHQSFFYSFITILPSESGVSLHYSTIFP